MVQNYVSFLKLAGKESLIVPTFEIDLIWHTPMRANHSYLVATEALCGFRLDHNDDIDKDTLGNAYKRTADRWKEIYKTEYGTNIDKNQLSTSQYTSNCALVSRTRLVIQSSLPVSKVVKSSVWSNDEGGNGGDDGCGDGDGGCSGDGGCGGCGGD
ncbi:unnamed protein product [Rotaria sp. Silwood2]|nr:unnamed protein product [Rotaria sp. Silwood2]CAF4484148.1 unnamed protein product [Rotaria sp. Silwood2]